MKITGGLEGWALVILAGSGVAHAGPVRSIDGAAKATDATPLHALTPVQQWNNASDMGFVGDIDGMARFADEMGDKLSELGRARLLVECISSEPSDRLARWAVCAADARAFDYKKLKAELKAEKGDELFEFAELDKNVKKAIAYFDAEVPKDKGLQAVMKVAESAQSEWKVFIDKNKDAFERYIALEDGVRSKKTNAKVFENCWEPTQAAFAKYVKAAKFPYEVDANEQFPAYMTYVVKDPGSYIAAVSYGACAYSIDPAGEAMYVAAAGNMEGTAFAGPRTMTIAKLMDEKFEPKFQDRSRQFDKGDFDTATVKPANANPVAAMSSPAFGDLSVVKANGDTVHLAFGAAPFKGCVAYKDTINGPVCAKQGMVENQENPTDIPKQFAAGMAKGNSCALVSNFPLDVYNKKKKKLIAMFGILLGK